MTNKEQDAAIEEVKRKLANIEKEFLRAGWERHGWIRVKPLLSMHDGTVLLYYWKVPVAVQKRHKLTGNVPETTVEHLCTWLQQLGVDVRTS